MKKMISIFMGVALLVTISACADSEGSEDFGTLKNEETSASSSESKDSQTDSAVKVDSAHKALVVYFSWSGNTENVAETIQTQSNADMFEVIPETAYSVDYDTVVETAQAEQRNHARPKIANKIENLDDYDVIYVGYPNWWGDMPMILYTFFDTYDLSNKTIAPFCTSGGSGLSDTVNTIKALEPNASVTVGLHIGSSSASDPEHAVSEWLSEIGDLK